MADPTSRTSRTAAADAAAQETSAPPRTSAAACHVRVPVARSKALTRALVWMFPAAVLGAGSFSVLRELDFSPTGLSNRIVEYGIALIVIPFAVAALVTGFLAVRWLLLAVWPARLGIEATGEALTLRLGPFGTRRYGVAALSVRYPFELIDEAEDIGFEAYLPEEQQKATLLPRIEAPGTPGLINEAITKFAVGSEADVARALRPAVAVWRDEGDAEADDGEGNGDE